MTGQREAELLEATNQLLDARRTLSPLAALPAQLAPTTLDESFFIQDQLIQSYGEIGGWKVGAGSADATPVFAPMPMAWVAGNGACMALTSHRFRGIEAEIAFQLAQDLPARATPYSREEVYAAVGSCHPAIEVLESALLDPLIPELRLQQIADLQMHGGFVYGPAIADWQKIDFTQQHVVLAVDGSVRCERTGSNTAGDLLRLLPWLANEGTARTGGLRAGQWITTGSWTGVTVAMSSSVADATFSTAGRVNVRFE